MRPSPAAAERLRRAVAERTDEYRVHVGMDLALVEALLEIGRPEAAAAALEDQTRVLDGYVRDLETLLAEATVEREAEHVVATAGRSTAADPPEPASARVDRRTARPAGGRSRRFAGAMIAATLVFGAIVPTVQSMRETPVEPFAAWEDTRAELAVARNLLDELHATPDEAHGVAEGVRLVHDRILALPPDVLADPGVRVELGQMLAEESARLHSLSSRRPDARHLLSALRNEVKALGVSLELDLPGLEEVLEPPVAEQLPEPEPQPSPPLSTDGQTPAAEQPLRPEPEDPPSPPAVR